MFIDPFSVFICGYTVSRCVCDGRAHGFSHTHTVPCLPRCSSSMSVCVHEFVRPERHIQQTGPSVLQCIRSYVHCIHQNGFYCSPVVRACQAEVAAASAVSVVLSSPNSTLFWHTTPAHYSGTLFPNTTLAPYSGAPQQASVRLSLPDSNINFMLYYIAGRSEDSATILPRRCASEIGNLFVANESGDLKRLAKKLEVSNFGSHRKRVNLKITSGHRLGN